MRKDKTLQCPRCDGPFRTARVPDDFENFLHLREDKLVLVVDMICTSCDFEQRFESDLEAVSTDEE